jgi:hypothetical protein
MTVSEALRQAIVNGGETHYRIGKETGVRPHVIDRFVSREREHLNTVTVDRLCEYLGLELRPRKKPRRKRPT